MTGRDDEAKTERVVDADVGVAEDTKGWPALLGEEANPE